MGPAMKHMLFFGFGFSAAALAARLDRKHWKITGTSRSIEGAAKITGLGHEGLVFDGLTEIPSTVTHIVSSVPPGFSDPVLDRFGASLAKNAAQFEWVAYLSTTGVYGDHAGGLVDEETPVIPNTERGHKRQKSESEWFSLFTQSQLPLHVFRLAGIYGPGRNVFEQLRAGTARRIIKQGQIFSRIHVDDIAGILAASLERPNPGRIYNVADDEACPPQDVVAFAAGLLNLPVPPDIAFADAKLNAMARSFYADSKRVANARVKDELHYQFRHPTYREGLRALLEHLPLCK
jgi:nucleoside-diphosphate-sugar epimerase